MYLVNRILKCSFILIVVTYLTSKSIYYWYSSMISFHTFAVFTVSTSLYSRNYMLIVIYIPLFPASSEVIWKLTSMILQSYLSSFLAITGKHLLRLTFPHLLSKLLELSSIYSLITLNTILVLFWWLKSTCHHF